MNDWSVLVGKMKYDGYSYLHIVQTLVNLRVPLATAIAALNCVFPLQPGTAGIDLIRCAAQVDLSIWKGVDLSIWKGLVEEL